MPICNCRHERTSLVAHADGSRAVARVISGVCDFVYVSCLCVRAGAVKGKRLELTTPNVVDVQSPRAWQSLGVY